MAYLYVLLISLVVAAFLIERSYRLHKVKKNSTELENKLIDHKNSHQEFSLRLHQLNNLASENFPRDPLTHLLSKEAFDDRLSLLISECERFDKSFAVMNFNINDFNLINKNNSDDCGNKVLIEVAARLKLCIRQIDTVVRCTGDDFLFILPNLAMPETAVYAAQRIIDSIALPIKIDEKELHVTSCIGITIYPHDGTNSATLLRNAQAALNKAKANGNNLYQFYQEETHMLGKRELSLKTFIKSNRFLNNVFMDYQSYINTLSNEEVCIQAMPVLNHDELGEVQFSEFFRIVDNAGRMAEFYEWMIKTAVAQFKILNSSNTKQLMLTFSLKQIENTEFIDKISDLIKSLQIPPQQLIFAIKDDIEGADAEALKRSFSVLNTLGVQTAIGILSLGHFALQKITNLPIRYLKIDNKLIRDIDTHYESKAILEKIIFLTNNMQIGVLTEGVEKEAQKTILEGLGCYVMQGDIFNKNKF